MVPEVDILSISLDWARSILYQKFQIGTSWIRMVPILISEFSSGIRQSEQFCSDRFLFLNSKLYYSLPFYQSPKQTLLGSADKINFLLASLRILQ